MKFSFNVGKEGVKKMVTWSFWLRLSCLTSASDKNVLYKTLNKPRLKTNNRAVRNAFQPEEPVSACVLVSRHCG